MQKKIKITLITTIALLIVTTGTLFFLNAHGNAEGFDYAQVPEYTGYPYVEINNNVPYFTKNEITDNCFESYSELDELGRCGPAFACIGIDIMPTEKRSNISDVKPSGWQTVRYDDVIKDKYLYNRCHLIAFMLAGENANPLNLITGTRYMNVTGMLPFEDEVNDYVQFTDNHVMYRVTPVFIDNELVARGVLMEAQDVENHGNSVQFCVFCYNVQPYITIDYATGNSWLSEDTPPENNTGWDPNGPDPFAHEYILNTKTKTFHETTCSSVAKMSDKNKQKWSGDRNDLIADGYKPCGICHP